MILTPLAFVVLLVMMYQGGTPVLSVQRWVLLGLIGLVNALPVTLFIRATPRLSASQLGACLFIAPLTGVCVSYFAFDVHVTGIKLLTLTLLSVGMALSVSPVSAHQVRHA